MAIKTPILQFGTSRFLQAHVDLFVDEALQKDQAAGKICVVQSSGDSTREHRLRALSDSKGYTVKIQGLQDGTVVDTEVQVTSICKSLSTQNDWAEITRIAAEDAEFILSNTGDTGFNLAAADSSAQFKQTMSYPAKLMHLLLARFEANARPIQIMPMELIANNGDVLRKRVLELATPYGEEFETYLNNSVRWVNSLVDRIVSEPLEPAGAIAEPYALWAIEEQSGLTLPCCHPCVQVVKDLEKSEALKLYILNLGHSYLAQLWLDKQDPEQTTVRGYLRQPDILAQLNALYRDEVMPAFVAAGMEHDAQRYLEVTLDRFKNPFLNHKLADIANHHAAKIERRLNAFLRWADSKGDTSFKPTISHIINNQLSDAGK